MAGTRKTAVAVVLAALALTATACNDTRSDGKNAAPAAPTAAASSAAVPSAAATPSAVATPTKVSPAAFLEQVTQKTSAAKSAKVTETITVGEVVMKGDGAIAWADGLQGELTMDLSGSPLGKAMSGLTGSQSAPYRFTKDGMFLRMGGEAVDALGGKHWVHYSQADQAKASGGMSDQLKSADPVEGVRALIATGKVTEVGQETVAGKATTHYSGVLNADEIAAAAGKSMTQDQLDQLKEKLTAAGLSQETIDVWVDADQLVVQRTEAGDTKAGAFKAGVLYSDYGVAVTTTAPAASDTVEAAELMKLAKQG
ncbi:hypothetical protein [Kitasatospora sp. SUK 42]|uniref:hypothetical protein n=1 Tax=Kitasatospora sp. SUK 42 TaxID=1588882 RepID=UPI0018CB2703|nr:hypothetical protein [Kitasatospora sp. SUK 42]MBV2154483.1 hypothetical protein [Kitasatospora sp. SUK 42]